MKKSFRAGLDGPVWEPAQSAQKTGAARQSAQPAVGLAATR